MTGTLGKLLKDCWGVSLELVVFGEFGIEILLSNRASLFVIYLFHKASASGTRYLEYAQASLSVPCSSGYLPIPSLESVSSIQLPFPSGQYVIHLLEIFPSKGAQISQLVHFPCSTYLYVTSILS